MKIGILALQGAVELHEIKLRELGVEPVQVRRSRDLIGLSGIILPGGESTTMIHLLKLNDLWDDLKAFVHTRPTWGVCAGSILLAKKVTHPEQISLDVMDIEVERNAFGGQVESFISPLESTSSWKSHSKSQVPVEGVFIRAPRIRSTFGDTQILLKWNEEPVLVEEEHLLASTFHPELTDATEIHQYFLNKCRVS